jgi:hypothetical protein
MKYGGLKVTDAGTAGAVTEISERVGAVEVYLHTRFCGDSNMAVQAQELLRKAGIETIFQTGSDGDNFSPVGQRLDRKEDLVRDGLDPSTAEKLSQKHESFCPIVSQGEISWQVELSLAPAASFEKLGQTVQEGEKVLKDKVFPEVEAYIKENCGGEASGQRLDRYAKEWGVPQFDGSPGLL